MVHGYEAKGLASTDIVVYALDKDGKKKDEQWIKSPWCGPIHDCAITPKWLILVQWPFEANVERMKKGGHHWAWSYDLPATFIVVPRRKSTRLPDGWKEGEYRVYHDRNVMLIHTAGAWEADDGNTLFIETTRVHDNGFPFFPPDDGRMPAADAKADFVRFKLDLSQPTGSKLAGEPEVVLDIPAEFPRLDERFLSKPYDVSWINVMTPAEQRDQVPPGDEHLLGFGGLDGVAMHRYSTGETKIYWTGFDGICQEPIFIPRSDDAPEGDGWVMCMVERRAANLCEVILLDTKDFTKPQAIIKLPFHVKNQVHGNWIDQRRLKDRQSLVREGLDVEISKRGALETWDIE